MYPLQGHRAEEVKCWEKQHWTGLTCGREEKEVAGLTNARVDDRKQRSEATRLSQKSLPNRDRSNTNLRPSQLLLASELKSASRTVQS